MLHASIGVSALPQGTQSSGTVTSSESLVGTSTGVPTITVSTAVPSPSASLGSVLPSQAALPPVQAWCPSEIFCAGPVGFVCLLYMFCFFYHLGA